MARGAQSITLVWTLHALSVCAWRQGAPYWDTTGGRLAAPPTTAHLPTSSPTSAGALTQSAVLVVRPRARATGPLNSCVLSRARLVLARARSRARPPTAEMHAKKRKVGWRTVPEAVQGPLLRPSVGLRTKLGRQTRGNSCRTAGSVPRCDWRLMPSPLRTGCQAACQTSSRASQTMASSAWHGTPP